jgi:hypothetical protein
MFTLSSYFTLAVAFIVYAAAALPWVLTAFFKREQVLAVVHEMSTNLYGRRVLAFAGSAVAAVAVFPFVLVYAVLASDPKTLGAIGMLYGASLQLQLIVDFFLVGFPLLLWLWPKGGAIALAAFREGVRQPLFWILFLLGFAFLAASPFLPYYTFGEDLLMVKDLGFDTMMLAATLFGALAASQSISDEIEGRTAITLMSKPVSRRQFLLGKYLGIVLASLLMFGLLSWVFENVLLVKHWFDHMDPVPPALWLDRAIRGLRLPDQPANLAVGIGMWVNHTLEVLPGLVMTFSEVMVLVALATALATRATVVFNIVTVFAVYFLANVTPVLVFIGNRAKDMAAKHGGNDPVAQLISFTAGVFETVLPDLDAFRIGPSLISETPVPAAYVASILFYGVLYTSILMFFGLILFEDKDLA